MAAAVFLSGCGGGGSNSNPPPPAAPTVASVTPANNAVGVVVTSTVTATFSEAMNASTITGSTFTLTPQGGSAVAATVVYSSNGNIATLTSSTPLAFNTSYTATITTGVTSSLGAALASNYTWNFTTESAPKTAVISTIPANGASSVNVSDALAATFNQPMNPTTITSSTFKLVGPGSTSVAGLVTYDIGTYTATFMPNSALTYSTSYTATITTGVVSASGAALASNYSWTFTTGANPGAVTVNFGTTYQTIRGFGASTAFLDPLNAAQVSVLFSPTNGLGLSALRVRIDPEGSSTSTPPYATSNWAQELTNAQEATAANPHALVFATPWTPPPAMKTSSGEQPYYSGTCGPAAGYCGGYLKPSDYAAYAKYLEGFVSYFASGDPAVTLYAISMQNEPDENVDYESCLWTGAQMDAWVASLTANGATDPLTSRLMMPESAVFNSAYSDPTLADADAVGNVSIIAGHLYMNGESEAIPFYYANAENAGKDVWATEHYLAPSGSEPAMNDALELAQEIHDSMTVGYYNAYVWWWIWNDDCQQVNYGLITDGTGQSGNACGTSDQPQPTYYGYAMGQFSKFIQPGFVRVDATANPLSGVYISAYDYTGSVAYPYHSAIVAINFTSSSHNLSFTLSGGNASSITSLTPYQTTSAAGLARQSAVTVSDQQFSYTLPAQSIVTFVQ